MQKIKRWWVKLQQVQWLIFRIIMIIIWDQILNIILEKRESWSLDRLMIINRCSKNTRMFIFNKLIQKKEPTLKNKNSDQELIHSLITAYHFCNKNQNQFKCLNKQSKLHFLTKQALLVSLEVWVQSKTHTIKQEDTLIKKTLIKHLTESGFYKKVKPIGSQKRCNG